MILRFSSIGDIVLTTPVIRCLKLQTGAELHFLCKDNFKTILETNPYLARIWSFQKAIDELIKDLKTENFDFIIDLHRNLRSLKVKKALNKPVGSFPKLNLEKWLMVNFKWNRLPKLHIVDRYFEATKSLGVVNDGEGLNYFLPEELNHRKTVADSYICLVLGAAHFTKQITIDKCIEICNGSALPIVLLGGKNEVEKARIISENVQDNVHDKTGQLSLHESALWIRDSKLVVTSDTGMMHIGAAFRKPMIVLWGNTIPEFGMYPYYGKSEDLSVHFEQKELPCRPCSKLGYERCPKDHFRCMEDISSKVLISTINEMIGRNS